MRVIREYKIKIITKKIKNTINKSVVFKQYAVMKSHIFDTSIEKITISTATIAAKIDKTINDGFFILGL